MQRHGRGRTRSLVALAAVFGTTLGSLGNAGVASAATAGTYVAILNHERVSHGLAPLQVDAALTAVARHWVGRMAATGSLRHNPQLRAQIRNWIALGENVGDGADLHDLAAAFWQSAEHRANILDRDYTQVGVATANGDGRLWIAVVFRQPAHTVTRVIHHRSTAVVPHRTPAPVTHRRVHPRR